ncbi:MAG: dolichyl-phosphate beta-glucosyltransferase [Candidatus Andersenbacteria bacterium]
MKSLSLIIPAYNEEKRLPPFLKSIADYVQQHPDYIQELLVIDDGSNDNTAAVTEKLARELPGFKLIKQPSNQGKGAAIKTGVQAATTELVVFIDADGATPVTELPAMREALTSAQIAVGNRWMPGAKVHRSSPLRHISGWVYKTYMSMFGLSGIDTMCGFKGYEVSVARDLFHDLIEPRWLFDTEIAYKAVQRGYRIKNFPIEWKSVDGSKLSSFDLLKSAMSIWPLIQRIKKQKI